MYRMKYWLIALLILVSTTTVSKAVPCSVSYENFLAQAERVERMSKPCAQAMNAGVSPDKMCAVCKPFAAQAAKFERLARNKNCFASESHARSNQTQLAYLRQIVKFSRRYCGN